MKEYTIYLNNNSVLICQRDDLASKRLMDEYKRGDLRFNIEASNLLLVCLGGVQAVLNELERNQINGAKLRFYTTSKPVAGMLNTGKCSDPDVKGIWSTLSRKITSAGHTVEAIEVSQIDADQMTEDLYVPVEWSNAPELWEPIEGTNGLYEISSCNRVYSHHTKGRRAKEGILKPVFVWKEKRKDGSKRGYYCVSIHVPGQPMRVRRIDHLVLEAFHGPRPPGCESCHYDDDPSNNHADNLYWGTRKDNKLDAKFNKPKAGRTVSRLESGARVRYWDHSVEKFAVISG